MSVRFPNGDKFDYVWAEESEERHNMVRGILWLCACALAPIVGKASTAATQEKSPVPSLAFAR